MTTTPRKPATGKTATSRTTTAKSAAKSTSARSSSAKPAAAKSSVAKATEPKATDTKTAETRAASKPETPTTPAPAEAMAAKVEEKVATMEAAAAETIRQAEAAMADVKSQLDAATAKRTAEAQSAMKAGQEIFAWNLEQGMTQGMTMGKEQFEKATGQFFAAFDDMQTRLRDGMDAMTSAGQAWNRGWEEIARSIQGTQQALLEDGMEAMKALLGAKTINDVVEVQSSFTRQTFDGVLSESIKLSELAMKVANDTAQPISTQVNKAMESAVKAS